MHASPPGGEGPRWQAATCYPPRRAALMGAQAHCPSLLQLREIVLLNTPCTQGLPSGRHDDQLGKAEMYCKSNFAWVSPVSCGLSSCGSAREVEDGGILEGFAQAFEFILQASASGQSQKAE